ncbi:hypothetical protein F4703DRAFT_1930034 [Phycomyces blakesleeanus]
MHNQTSVLCHQQNQALTETCIHDDYTAKRKFSNKLQRQSTWIQAFCPGVNMDRNYSDTSTLTPSDENSESSYDQSSSPVKCECGKTLESGWSCENCRRNCPYCNRMLTTDPEDYCTRCYRYCTQHGAYLIISLSPTENSSAKVCPKCAES